MYPLQYLTDIYFGIVLAENLDYDTTASIVAKSTGRALGFLFAEAKAYEGREWSRPYDYYTTLFDCLIHANH